MALLMATACSRCGGSRHHPAPRARPVAGSTAYDPVPPGVAAAMAFRGTDGCKALKLLQDEYDKAALAGDVRAASIALHRAGDVYRDELGNCEGVAMLERVYSAADLYQRAYVLHRLRGDERLAGLAANDLGIDTRSEGGDFVLWFDEAVRLRRDAGTPDELQISLNNLGGALMLHGRGERAVQALDESLALAVDAGNPVAERKVRINLAASELVLAEDGGVEHQQRAVAHLQRVRVLTRDAGSDDADVCHGLRIDQVALCERLLAQ